MPIHSMKNGTYTIEFIDGSQDGRVLNVIEVPDHFGVVIDGLKEVYQRQTEEEPFVYVQIGYIREGVWQC